MQVREIGLKSDWISLERETLSNWLIMEHFNKSGKLAQDLERFKSSCQANRVIIHYISQRINIRTVITKKLMEPFLMDILTSQ